MFSRIREKYKKYKSDKKEKQIEIEKRRKVQERNQKILKIVKVICFSICAIFFLVAYIGCTNDFRAFIKQNIIYLLVPIWIYLIVLLAIDSFRAIIEIVVLIAAFSIFGIFAFLAIAFIVFVSEELLTDLISD